MCVFIVYYNIALQKVTVYIAKITAKRSNSFGTKHFMSNRNGCSDAVAVCWKTVRTVLRGGNVQN